MRLGIVELYCGKSGKKGYYNNQEIGLARAMKKKGYDTIIFYPQVDNDRVIEETLEEKIKIVYVPAKTVGNHSYYDWNILIKYNIDVAQIGSDNQLFAPSIIHFCDKNRIKIYNYLGTIESDTDNILKKSIMKTLFVRNARFLKKHKCFAKTKTVYEELTKMGFRDVTVAPVGLDISIIPEIVESQRAHKEKADLPEGKKILLFVGRADSYKRPLDALILLESLPKEYYLVMIGSGELDTQIDMYIEKNSLHNRIKRIKKLPNTEIHQYYRLADYYLNFNEKEIFGMSILEAMYQNCPVIAIHAPGPDEILDVNSGFLVCSLNEMKKIIISNNNGKDLKPRERVLSRFTWDRTADIFDNWIRGQHIEKRFRD